MESRAEINAEIHRLNWYYVYSDDDLKHTILKEIQELRQFKKQYPKKSMWSKLRAWSRGLAGPAGPAGPSVPQMNT